MQAFPSPPKLSTTEWSICEKEKFFTLKKAKSKDDEWKISSSSIGTYQGSQWQLLINNVHINKSSISGPIIIFIQWRPVEGAFLLSYIYKILKKRLEKRWIDEIKRTKIWGLGTNLLWSLHMSTKFLWWYLNILKKTAVYSCNPFEAKTSRPKGPSPLLMAEPFWLHRICGSVQDSKTSAFPNSFTSNEISTSACTRQMISLF